MALENVREKALATQGMMKEELERLPYVASATLIGSGSSLGGEEGSLRRIEHVNDFDNVIVVQGPMTKQRYAEIRRVFENLRNFTNGDTDVLYAIADGPMKPPSEKANEIFKHVILHTEETYRHSPLEIVENSWQYENPYLGKPLAHLRRIPGVSKEMLLNGALGINHLLELVKRDESAYLGWEEAADGGMQMKLSPLKFQNPDERLELYFYSILRCASNTMRYATGDNKIGIELSMCDRFERACSDFEYRRFPREAYTDKRLLRNRKLVLSEGFANNWQAKAVDFLGGLAEYVQKR